MRCGNNDREDYHHGSLRRALIDYAVGRVRKSGVDAFSLREAARAAGVSSGAAYRHFSEKHALLVAVAHEGFKSLAEKTAKATHGTAGPERLRAIAHAYITFASDDPNLFRLMFSQICMSAARAIAPDESDVSPALTQMRAALADVTGTDSDSVDENLLAVAWSTAHGAASLICDGVWTRDDKKAHAAVDEVVRMALGRRASVSGADASVHLGASG